MQICSQLELQNAIENTKDNGKTSLKELLLQSHAISATELSHLIATHPEIKSNYELIKCLKAFSPTNRTKFDTAYAASLDLPFVRLSQFDFNQDALEMIQADFARNHRLIPLTLYRERLLVAMANPTDIETLNMLHFMTKHLIEPVYASEEDIDIAISQFYSPSDDEEVLKDIATENPNTANIARQEERLAADKPTVKLINNLILDAINRHASDIHIRPKEKDVEIIFRIDGELVKIRNLTRAMLNAAVARIKILGGMNIAEHRLPQDGRAKIMAREKPVDLRISIMPCIYGESVVIRILDTSAGLKSIEDLGFSPKDAEQFRHIMHKSSGLFLVTGPTGSGKSTTLYAALQEVVKRNINVITVEDPVEYHLDQVLQIQTQAAIGYTFARALRNILRHDPNAIMIGEIRDEETAKIAVESALTGHLVLSTLHTNSAASTVTRLLEIGIPAYLLRSTLLGVLAQRLVRKNCPHCQAEEVIEPSVRSLLQIGEHEIFYRGRGCDQCRGTGYRGRVAVYEQLNVTGEIKECITQNISAVELERIAIKQGMQPLTRQALSLAKLKVTSIEEVYRIRLD
ncbi:MAG: type II/IV secretion system protein [Hahellaceae bacterium]|nr:type II/IV secretion system protein [Hahellaceae bacterium]